MDKSDLIGMIMSDMDACLEDECDERRAEERRLRASTDPDEHMCGPDCPHLRSIESNRESVHYVCPISHLTWGCDTKWDPVLAGKCAHSDERNNTYGSRKRSADVMTLQEEAPMAMDSSTERESTSRAAPKPSRENNLLESHYALRSMAANNIYQVLEAMTPQTRDVAHICQELLATNEHDRMQHLRPFVLTQLNDVYIEAHRRSVLLKQRSLLHRHVVQKTQRIEQFVNVLAQLFATLWIIITHNQVRRREIDSFRVFIQSLLNCLHRGIRVSNQPILPKGILFFHDTKRKHRSDSAHHALQQVQQVLGSLDSVTQTEHFEQCIRLSKQLEGIHDKLINEPIDDHANQPVADKPTCAIKTKAEPRQPTSRDNSSNCRPTGATSGSSPNS